MSAGASVTRSKYSVYLQDFKRLDTDHSGKLDKDEIKQMVMAYLEGSAEPSKDD